MNEQNLRGPVVVIGAGILGCSAAWHLLRAGVRELTLVDAGGVGSGTSSAGAGFVALWAAGFFPAFGTAELEMEHYSLAFYRDLHEAGAEIGYRNNGNLLLVPSVPGLVGTHDSERAHAMVQHPDAPAGTRELSAAEVAALTGVVRADRVEGGSWQPAGIQVEAAAAVSVLADAVRGMGGSILEDTPVIGLRTRGNELDAVLTPSRALPARAVVLAAGAWTNGLLGHLGVDIPLARMVATRLVTGPAGVPPTMPTIQGAGGWLRECRAGYTWGSGTAYRPAYELEADGHEIPLGRPRISELFEHNRAVEPQWAEIFRDLTKPAVVEWLQGMPCYTPDQRLYVGRAPSAPNLVVIAGDNETGVTHGPSMGRLAAELVLDHTPFVDIAPFRLDRFAAGSYPDESHVLAAVRPVSHVSREPVTSPGSSTGPALDTEE